MHSLSCSFIISVFSTVNLSLNQRIQYLLCGNYCPKLIYHSWVPSYFLGKLNMIIWSFSQLLSMFAGKFDQFTKYYYLLFLKYNSVLVSYSQDLTAPIAENYYLTVLHVRNLTWVALGWRQHVVRTALLLEVLGEDLFLRFSQLLEATFTTWLLDPSSIFRSWQGNISLILHHSHIFWPQLGKLLHF